MWLHSARIPWAYLKFFILLKGSKVRTTSSCCAPSKSALYPNKFRAYGRTVQQQLKKSPSLLKAALARWEGGGGVLECCCREKRWLFHHLPYE